MILALENGQQVATPINDSNHDNQQSQDASQAKVNEKLASKWTRSLEEVNSSFDLWSAFSYLVIQRRCDFFFNNWYNGASTVETSGRKLS